MLKAWEIFAIDYSLDAAEVAQATHGRRLSDTLREWCRIDDEDTLRAEITRFEQAVVDGGLAVLPGARELLSQLAANPTLRWTIVTSATRDFARRAIERCSLPFPVLGLVTSDDVPRGKPNPDPYLAGADKCNVNPTACLVVEDAPSGLRAGCAAGAKTLAVCTSHTRQLIEDSGAKPNWIVSDLTRVSARVENDGVAITIEK